MFLFFPVMMLLSALGSAAYGMRDNRRSGEIEEGRRDYLRYLDALDATAARTAVAQHESVSWTHPDPRALWTLIGGRRMWERLPGDADFCQVRVGLSTSGLSTRLVKPEVSTSGHADHVVSEWLRRFLAHRSAVADLPVTVDLAAHRWITLGGDVVDARGSARAIICELAVLHGPDHVKVIAVVDEGARAHWDWLKWLPHHQHPHAVDAVGTARMTYRRLDDAQLGAGGAHVVVLVDGGDVTGVDPMRDDVTLVQVGDVAAASARSVALTATLRAETAGALRLDALTQEQAEVCARRLAPFTEQAVVGADHREGTVGRG